MSCINGFRLFRREAANIHGVRRFERPHESLNPRHNGQKPGPAQQFTASASGCLREMAMRPGKPASQSSTVVAATSANKIAAKVA